MKRGNVNNRIVMFTIMMHGVAILVGCNHSVKKNMNEETVHSFDTLPGFKREVFIDRFGKYDYNYTFIQKDIERSKKLKYLDRGFDSLAIRLWYVYFGPKTQIVEIKRKSESWEGQFLTIERQIKNSGKDTTVTIEQEVNIIPKSGWELFIKKVLDLGITTKLGSSEIPNYDAPTDGDGVVVEISTKLKYRIYSYWSPGFNSSIKEAKEIEDIMELIDKEFGINRLRKL